MTCWGEGNNWVSRNVACVGWERHIFWFGVRFDTTHLNLPEWVTI